LSTSSNLSQDKSIEGISKIGCKQKLQDHLLVEYAVGILGGHPFRKT